MNGTKDPLLQVAAKAVIVDEQGKVLVARESDRDKNNTRVGEWGIIGGRLNPGEAFLDGLKREVLEETGLDIEVLRPMYVGEWRPVIRDVPHQIVGVYMLCKAKNNKIVLSVEHDEYMWIDPKKRHNYPVMEPDCFALDILAQESTEKF